MIDKFKDSKDLFLYLSYPLFSTNDIAKMAGVKKHYVMNKVVRNFKIKKYRYIDSVKIGDRFGDLEVIDILKPDKNKTYGKYSALCQCKCGNRGVYPPYRLVSGSTPAGCRNCASNKKLKFQKEGIIEGSWFNRLLVNAQRRKIQFNLLPSDLDELFKKQEGKCALSGVEINVPLRNYDQNHKKFNASLDRIDNKIGYIVGNVQFVHKIVNYMKSTSTDEEFIKWCEVIVNYQKGRRNNGFSNGLDIKKSNKRRKPYV